MSIAFICNSQNVYILGNATPEDADKIVSIVRQMHLKLSIKECSVFYNVASSSTIRILACVFGSDIHSSLFGSQRQPDAYCGAGGFVIFKAQGALQRLDNAF